MQLTVKSSYAELQTKYGLGQQSVDDIIAELARPGLDPRESFDEGQFRSDILSIEDLKVGMTMTGVVRNIVDFGAFVDIGVKNDGLIHKSQLTSGYVANPFDVVSIGQTLQVTVTAIDLDRGKVSLSSKDSLVAPASPAPAQRTAAPARRVEIKKPLNATETGIKGNVVWR